MWGPVSRLGKRKHTRCSKARLSALGLPQVSWVEPLACGIRVRTFCLAWGLALTKKKPPPQLKRIRDQHSRCFEPCVLCSALADKTQVLTAALVGVTTQRKNDFALGLRSRALANAFRSRGVERVSKSSLGLPAYIYLYTPRDVERHVRANGTKLVSVMGFCVTKKRNSVCVGGTQTLVTDSCRTPGKLPFSLVFKKKHTKKTTKIWRQIHIPRHATTATVTGTHSTPYLQVSMYWVEVQYPLLPQPTKYFISPKYDCSGPQK